MHRKLLRIIWVPSLEGGSVPVGLDGEVGLEELLAWVPDPVGIDPEAEAVVKLEIAVPVAVASDVLPEEDSVLVIEELSELEGDPTSASWPEALHVVLKAWIAWSL
jgi:hypothetical protein